MCRWYLNGSFVYKMVAGPINLKVFSLISTNKKKISITQFFIYI